MEITARRNTRGAQRTGGDAAPALSLPKGGGAFRGIGEKFGANPVTGTASFTIPIYTSPGRSRFSPKLSLSYDSGGGKGEERQFLVQFSRPVSGYYKRDDDGRWQSCVSFDSSPNVEWTDPSLRSVDLDGDGFPDILVTEHDALVWYPFLGRKVLVSRKSYLSLLTKTKGRPLSSPTAPSLSFWQRHGAPGTLQIRTGRSFPLVRALPPKKARRNKRKLRTCKIHACLAAN